MAITPKNKTIVRTPYDVSFITEYVRTSRNFAVLRKFFQNSEIGTMVRKLILAKDPGASHYKTRSKITRSAEFKHVATTSVWMVTDETRKYLVSDEVINDLMKMMKVRLGKG